MKYMILIYLLNSIALAIEYAGPWELCYQAPPPPEGPDFPEPVAPPKK